MKTDFSGNRDRNAIYKVLLKGSECPQRLNAALEKWYSLEPGEEVRRDEYGTWTWKSMTACVFCVWQCVRHRGRRKTHKVFFYNPKVPVNVTEVGHLNVVMKISIHNKLKEVKEQHQGLFFPIYNTPRGWGWGLSHWLPGTINHISPPAVATFPCQNQWTRKTNMSLAVQRDTDRPCITM